MTERLVVTEIAPDGLGFGEGSISYRAREKEVGSETIVKARKAIMSDRILVPVARDSKGNIIRDDGCSDGRGVLKIYKGVKEFIGKSLHRAKVFGAGLTMGLAGRIGVQGLQADNLEDEFEATADQFDKQGLEYGAHSDMHAKGHNCGCGAIDKAPIIIGNAIKFEDQIRASLDVLGASEDLRDQVFAHYRVAAKKLADKPYAGKTIWNKIRSRDKVNKELGDEHLEMFVVLNAVRDTTVDQELVREVTGGKVQVFALDLWRLVDIAKQQYPEDQKAAAALLSEQVYTLATAGTLTAGDLPVFLIDGEAAFSA